MNADDADSLNEWEAFSRRNPQTVPIFVAERDNVSERYRTLKRPLAFRKFVQILEAITATSAGSASQESTEGRLRILVVDDSFPSRQFMQLQLEEMDSPEQRLCVELAASGEEAVEAHRRARYDLIFLDVVMAGLDGFETCRRLRNEDKAVRIAMLTGKTMETDHRQGRKAGCDHYVNKPPRETEIRDIVLLASATRGRQRETA